ncbi:MAG TPA: hypothetical protein VG755_37310, partial [Nannocystaceae bacterium]|nr:hypothetical protein [Nannocystaceae bacterium]
MKRIAKALAWIVATLLLLVVTTLAVVLYTPWGTRTALRFALDRYDGAVPGSLAVGDIAGTLGGRLVLDDVALWDREDNPLIAIAHLELELRLVDLLHATVGFDRFAVAQLHVWVGGERAAFGDLGPEGPPKPKPEGKVGPDLPIGFAGPLAVDGLAIHQWTDDGELVDIIAHGGIAGSLESHGRDATLLVDSLWAVLPQATVAGLSATITWSDPEVRIDDLVVLSDRGVVHRGALGFDAYTQTGDASLGVVVDLAAIVPRSQLPVHGP